MKTARRVFGRSSHFFGAISSAFLLLACSPDYNWRQIPGPDQDYQVMLPAKPASMTRDIQLGAIKVSMTMQGAKVNETTFTVAVANLPDNTAQSRQQALTAMQQGMLANIAASSHREEQVSIKIVDSMGASRGSLPAVRVQAEGRAQGKPVRMQAGFAAIGSRAYQWVVIGPQSGNPGRANEQAVTFLDSFMLMQTGATQ